MSSLLEKSLDDIIGQQKPNRRFNKKSFRGGKVGKSFHRGGKGRTTLSRRNNNNNNNNNIGNPKEIRISNLHPDLTNDDLSKLMTTIGPTVKVNLIFNTHGKSTGIAFIEFQHIEDARKAIENFDGRLAAGQTIRVTSTVPINERISLALPQQNQNQLKSKKKNNQKNSIDKQKHKRKPRPTFEDLDNELDNYMNGDNTSNNDNNDNDNNNNNNLNEVVVQTEIPIVEDSTPVLHDSTENVNVIVPAFESTTAPATETTTETDDVAME